MPVSDCARRSLQSWLKLSRIRAAIVALRLLRSPLMNIHEQFAFTSPPKKMADDSDDEAFFMAFYLKRRRRKCRFTKWHVKQTYVGAIPSSCPGTVYGCRQCMIPTGLDRTNFVSLSFSMIISEAIWPCNAIFPAL
jgi:hypothetical protein